MPDSWIAYSLRLCLQKRSKGTLCVGDGLAHSVSALSPGRFPLHQAVTQPDFFNRRIGVSDLIQQEVSPVCAALLVVVADGSDGENCGGSF